MNDNELDILDVLTPYLAIFPESKLDTAGLMLYARALSDVPAVQVSAAMVKLLQTVKFFPKVSEILEAVESLQSHITKVSGGDTVCTPAEAWEQAMNAVKSIGIYGEWELPPEVQQAVKQFGKMELCVLEAEAVNTARAQFMKIYNGIISQKNEAYKNERAINSLSHSTVEQLVNKISGELKQIEV